MKKVVSVLCIMILAMSMLTACGSKGIKGTWKLTGFMDGEEYMSMEEYINYYGYVDNGMRSEITFYDDGTYALYTPSGDLLEDGGWEDCGDGYYEMGASFTGGSAYLEGDKLYVEGMMNGYSLIFERC